MSCMQRNLLAVHVCTVKGRLRDGAVRQAVPEAVSPGEGGASAIPAGTRTAGVHAAPPDGVERGRLPGKVPLEWRRFLEWGPLVPRPPHRLGAALLYLCRLLGGRPHGLNWIGLNWISIHFIALDLT